MIKKILHITPDFNYSCGRSKLVFLYLKYFEKKEGYETHFITNGGDSLERLKEIPIVKFKRLPFSTGLNNIFYYNRFFKKLKKYAADNDINLIHTHHRFPEYVSVKLSKELNIRTITSAHSFVGGYKSISFNSDIIISVSNILTSYLIKNFNINRERIATLYNPVEETPENRNEQDELRKILSLFQDQKVILFVGKINYEKGFDKLINSYEILYGKDKNIILIICGIIEEKNFQELRKKIIVPIIIVPPNNNNWLLYQIADVVVLPSKIESLSNTMLETGINKKPFIGSNTGGISEFIENGRDGLIIDPENENELAEKILFLLHNEVAADKMGNNLYKKVRDKCDYQNYFSRVEEIYNSLLS